MVDAFFEDRVAWGAPSAMDRLSRAGKLRAIGLCSGEPDSVEPEAPVDRPAHGRSRVVTALLMTHRRLAVLVRRHVVGLDEGVDIVAVERPPEVELLDRTWGCCRMCPTSVRRLAMAEYRPKRFRKVDAAGLGTRAGPCHVPRQRSWALRPTAGLSSVSICSGRTGRRSSPCPSGRCSSAK